LYYSIIIIFKFRGGSKTLLKSNAKLLDIIILVITNKLNTAESRAAETKSGGDGGVGGGFSYMLNKRILLYIYIYIYIFGRVLN
jgi:hypothetical protein